ncbi:hypothetical protein DXG01_016529 [Tephrocybe rancida]|nr:hypothetical protein DXG01_016529 [Tephrocybe rancida]
MEQACRARTRQITSSLLALLSSVLPLVSYFASFVSHNSTPVAGGTVSLNSTDPFVPPLIDPAYMTTEFDMVAMREGVKAAQRFLTAPIWKDYIVAPAGGLENVTSEESLDDYIRAGTLTSAHPVGTAAMSAKNASSGVVDPDLRVKKISGLRIVDASVMPFVTAAHPQAAIYAIAERASDLIKDAWKIKREC